MSDLNAGISEGRYVIRSWKGVRETAGPGLELEAGEAVSMKNFRVTSGGELRLRPGRKRLIGLLTGYYAAVSEEVRPLITAPDYLNEKLTLYSGVTTDETGAVRLSGDAAQVGWEDASAYAGWYYAGEDGAVYALASCLTAPAPGDGAERVDGGWIHVGAEYCRTGVQQNDGGKVCTTVYISGGELKLRDRSGNPYTPGYYVESSGGTVYRTTGRSYSDGTTGMSGSEYYYHYGYEVSIAGYDSHVWSFHPVTAESNAAQQAVRALWSGTVAGTERLMAVCSGHLWSLSESGGVWSRADAGSLDTSGRVAMFGFDGRLYIVNGRGYYVYDGSRFYSVEGYVPCVVTAAAPSGGGQSLEQVNALTLRRRQKFSSDGTATVYQLAETQLSSIDAVEVNGSPVTGCTADTDAGTVTFSSAPAAGSSNVQIWYTASLTKTASYTGDGTSRTFAVPGGGENVSSVTAAVGGSAAEGFTVSDGAVTFSSAPAAKAAVVITAVYASPRDKITGMRSAEFFNGAGDNRVFLYGDGSARAVYSGIREDTGKPSMEYFPDLNEMTVGNDNTPITAMIRYYSRLLIFKPGSTYSAYYSGISLADGVSTAGFYVSGVNRELGCTAPGQAVLVGSRPRTPDNASIYEWYTSTATGLLASGSADAKRISRNVELTLSGFDTEKVLCYYDKLAHEYYAVCGGTAAVQNTETGAWFVYTDFPAESMLRRGGLLLAGTGGGEVHAVGEEYKTDNGAAIAAEWRSGALDFGKPWARKYSPRLWLALEPEADAALTAAIVTDGITPLPRAVVSAPAERASMNAVRLKSGRFSFMELELTSPPAGVTAAVSSLAVQVKFTGDRK